MINKHVVLVTPENGCVYSHVHESIKKIFGKVTWENNYDFLLSSRCQPIDILISIDLTISVEKIKTIQIFEGLNAYKIHVGCDDEYMLMQTLSLVQYYDGFITFDTVTKELLSQYNVPVRLAPHPTIQMRSKEIDPIYDLSFIGRVDKTKPQRESLLKELQKKYNCFFPGLDGGFLKEEDMYKAFKHTKINLNFSGVSYYNMGLAFPNQTRRSGYKGRVYEIASVGKFTLTEHNTTLESSFSNNKDIIFFKGMEELKFLIDAILSDDKTLSSLNSAAYLNFLTNADSSNANNLFNKAILDLTEISNPHKGIPFRSVASESYRVHQLLKRGNLYEALLAAVSLFKLKTSESLFVVFVRYVINRII